MIEDCCPECKGKLINNDTEIYCESCGLVIGEPIERSGQTYEGTDGERSKACGPPHKWVDPNSGTYSMIGNNKEFQAWKRKRYQAFHK